jgi:hypothetical protein
VGNASTAPCVRRSGAARAYPPHQKRQSPSPNLDGSGQSRTGATSSPRGGSWPVDRLITPASRDGPAWKGVLDGAGVSPIENAGLCRAHAWDIRESRSRYARASRDP